MDSVFITGDSLKTLQKSLNRCTSWQRRVLGLIGRWNAKQIWSLELWTHSINHAAISPCMTAHSSWTRTRVTWAWELCYRIRWTVWSNPLSTPVELWVERNRTIRRQREAWVVVLSLKWFRPYIWGLKLVIRTDLSSLHWLFPQNSDGQTFRMLQRL